MDKKQFLSVLHHFNDSSLEEAQEILSLKADFPYSQLLHALSARVSKDHGFSNQQNELQLAAVYASDRAVLKEIMSKTFADDFRAPAYSSSLPPTIEKSPSADAQSMDVADEIIHDLDRLHELKHNFEMMFVDVPQTEIKKKPAPEPKPDPKAEPKPEPKAKESKPKESAKSKKARIIELAKAMAAGDASAHAEEHKPVHKKKANPGDSLIEEIKSTKKELEPKGEKLKEQIEIIDQFIKTQPTISNTKEKIASAPVGDLSSIKSGEFSDNIVSETLVEILVQQGKKDKAIEVLKKLIWKFPQKKAYFAAQIEELKK